MPHSPTSPTRSALRALPALLALLLAVTPAMHARAQETAVPPSVLGPTEPPPAVEGQVQTLSRALDEVDSQLLLKQPEQAMAGLEQVERELEVLRTRHGDQLPMGYVPLLVVEERAAALRQQLTHQP